jgi:hypothetical protein
MGRRERAQSAIYGRHGATTHISARPRIELRHFGLGLVAFDGDVGLSQLFGGVCGGVLSGGAALVYPRGQLFADAALPRRACARVFGPCSGCVPSLRRVALDPLRHRSLSLTARDVEQLVDRDDLQCTVRQTGPLLLATRRRQSSALALGACGEAG